MFRDQDVAPGASRHRQSQGRAVQQTGLRDLPHPAPGHQGDHAEVRRRPLRDHLQYRPQGLRPTPSNQGQYNTLHARRIPGVLDYRFSASFHFCFIKFWSYDKNVCKYT